MAFTILSVRLPSGEYPVCGVALEPYVQCRKENNLTATAEELPEEGQSGARFCLRFRWYRSVVQRSGANCWIHPDREACLQCILCLRHKVDIRKSYHCTPACLRQHWPYHKELHEQREQRKQNGIDLVLCMARQERADRQASRESRRAGSLSGRADDIHLTIRCRSAGHFENGYAGGYDLHRPVTHSDNGETWIEVPILPAAVPMLSQQPCPQGNLAQASSVACRWPGSGSIAQAQTMWAVC